MIHLQQIEVHSVHISWSTFHCSFILQKVKVVIWMQAVGWKYTETKLTTFPGSPFFLLMFSRVILHNGFSSNTSSYMWVLLPMVIKYQHCTLGRLVNPLIGLIVWKTRFCCFLFFPRCSFLLIFSCSFLVPSFLYCTFVFAVPHCSFVVSLSYVLCCSFIVSLFKTHPSVG